jgi:hypothetical protein
MTQGLHGRPVSLVTEFKQLLDENPKHHVEICLTSSQRYWVKAITEEWEDAIRIITEMDGVPVYLMKHTIQTMMPTKRAPERIKE